jgi:parallel beta-helix repeat protein
MPYISPPGPPLNPSLFWNGSIWASKVRPNNVVTVGPAGSQADFVCDGVQDEVEINDAISAATDSSKHGGTVLLLPGQFVIDTDMVNLKDNITLEGSGMGKTKVVAGLTFPNTLNHVIGAIGATTGSLINLTADAFHGQTTIKVSPSGDVDAIQRDDYLFLLSEALWEDTAFSGRKRGEYIKVVNKGINRNGSGASITAYSNKVVTLSNVSGFNSVTDVGYTITISGASNSNQNGTFLILSVNGPGTQITLYNPRSGLTGTDVNNGSIAWSGPTLTLYGAGARDEYLVTDLARAYRMAFVKNVTIRNLEMFQLATDGTRDGAPPFISMRRVLNGTVENVYLHNNDGPGVVIESSVSTQVRDCRIHDLWDFSGTSGEYGYGILVGNASENIVVSDSVISRVRHGVDTGQWAAPSSPVSGFGVVRGMVVSGIVVSHATAAAFSTHAECEGVHIMGCTASNCDNAGILMRGKSCRIVGCSIERCSGGIQIGHASSSAPTFIGSGCVVEGNVIRHIKNIATGAADVKGTGSGEGGGNGIGISISRASHVTVKNNIVEMCDRSGIRVRKRTYRSLVDGNTILDCNKDNSSGASGSAIHFETPKTGTAMIAKSGSTITLMLTSGDQAAADVGAKIKVTGAPSPGNNGVFTILTVPTTTSVTYTNAAGVNGESCNWEEESSSYNVICRNLVANRPFIAGDPANSAERDVTGHLKYMFQSDSTFSSHNMVFDNIGMNMESGLVLSSSTDDFIHGNRTNEAPVLPAIAGAVSDSSFPSAPPQGAIAVDAANNKIYFKTTAGWKSVTGT